MTATNGNKTPKKKKIQESAPQLLEVVVPRGKIKLG